MRYSCKSRICVQYQGYHVHAISAPMTRTNHQRRRRLMNNRAYHPFSQHRAASLPTLLTAVVISPGAAPARFMMRWAFPLSAKHPRYTGPSSSVDTVLSSVDVALSSVDVVVVVGAGAGEATGVGGFGVGPPSPSVYRSHAG